MSWHATRLALLCIICGLLFFHRLSDRELSSSHEARAAQNAQMILSDGDWGLPRLFDGRVELQKPPLYYWLVALIAWLRGGPVDALAVRLPAALAALGCVWFLYFLMCRCGRPRAGFVAALVLATCGHFTWLARVGRIDMPLTFAITLALGGFYLGYRAHRDRRPGGWRWFLLGYLGVAVGILLKGPIAAILPFAAAGGWLTLDWRAARRFPARALSTLAWGLPLVLAATLPWFLWANGATQNRLWEVFFWHHNIERAVSGTLVSHPWWFYGPRLLVDLLPWIPLALIAVYVSRTHRTRHTRNPAPETGAAAGLDNAPPDTEARFGLTWLIVMTAVLSLMSFKRADYLLPAYPGFALWLGCRLDRWLDALEARPDRAKMAQLLPTGFGALVTACLIGWIVYLEWVGPGQHDAHSYRRFAAEIRRRTALPVIFFRVEAHELAFHVGRPLDTILEWENLEVWATQPQPIYIVMPPDCVRDWRQHLQRGRLQVILRTRDLAPDSAERPLVLVRSSTDTDSATEESCEVDSR